MHAGQHTCAAAASEVRSWYRDVYELDLDDLVDEAQSPLVLMINGTGSGWSTHIPDPPTAAAGKVPQPMIPRSLPAAEAGQHHHFL